MCIEDVKHYVWNTWQIGKIYLPLKKKEYFSVIVQIHAF